MDEKRFPNPVQAGPWVHCDEVKPDWDKVYLGWDTVQNMYFVINGYYLHVAKEDRLYNRTIRNSYVAELS